MQRCGWAEPDEIYIRYHDHEWGVPEYDDQKLWQMLVLESFQAGLSWITILRRRDGFIKAFQGFDPNIIATWGDVEVADLVQNTAIIRHRGKIEATIGNARAWRRQQAGAGFSSLLWGAVGGRTLQNNWHNPSEVPAETAISLKLSADLKAAGFRFCGSKMVYALMQAAGLVNDHLISCPRHGRLVGLAADRTSRKDRVIKNADKF